MSTSLHTFLRDMQLKCKKANGSKTASPFRTPLGQFRCPLHSLFAQLPKKQRPKSMHSKAETEIPGTEPIPDSDRGITFLPAASASHRLCQRLRLLQLPRAASVCVQVRACVCVCVDSALSLLEFRVLSTFLAEFLMHLPPRLLFRCLNNSN